MKPNETLQNSDKTSQSPLKAREWNLKKSLSSDLIKPQNGNCHKTHANAYKTLQVGLLGHGSTLVDPGQSALASKDVAFFAFGTAACSASGGSEAPLAFRCFSLPAGFQGRWAQGTLTHGTLHTPNLKPAKVQGRL